MPGATWSVNMQPQFRWKDPKEADASLTPLQTAALVQRARSTGLVSIRGHILREPIVVHPAVQPAGVDFSSYVDSKDAPILPTIGVHRCLEWYKPVPDDLRMSPLLAEDFSGLPPAYVQIAGVDPLRSDAFAYIDKLQAAGYC